MRFKAVLFLAVLAMIFSSCFRPSGTKPRGRNHVEVFYKGEGKMLYFVRPLHLELEEGGDAEMRMDFSYNFSIADSLSDSVVANFSIYDDVSHAPTALQLGESTPLEARPLFHEKRKRAIVSRYTATMPYAVFEAFIKAEDPSIIVTTKDKNLSFEPDKWEKYSRNVEEELVNVVRIYYQ